MTTPESRIFDHLAYLYGEPQASQTWPQIEKLLRKFRDIHPRPSAIPPSPADRLSEKDVILIVYGDQFSTPDNPPLQNLSHFLTNYLPDVFSGVHILPFYPFSSDDGFSVIDYRQVDPALGDWNDVSALGEHYRLMFDAVINHISQESDWFKAFKNNRPPYSEYFIRVDPDEDLSSVVRPRALPLLREVKVPQGVKHVWSTFSDDQIDLNYANPRVLLEIIELLLFYVGKGAELIRLDAIAYLWKKIGTSCIHLPQTHQVVKLFRAVLDAVAPDVLLITETNVPHKENISYFGEQIPGTDSFDEAQMVYQFPLAPLVLHSFVTGDASPLLAWVKNLALPSPSTTFFNFIASHDGIGIMPVSGLLNESEIDTLVQRTISHGGQVSYKTNSDGSKSVYELNVTLYDALNDPNNPDEHQDIRRFLASQAIMLSLAGVPGIYVHSLFGSRNCHTCASKTKRSRSINREKFSLKQIETDLANNSSRRANIFDEFLTLLRKRKYINAFHPNAGQQVLSLPHKSIFCLVRSSERSGETVIVLINVSQISQRVDIDTKDLMPASSNHWQDVISGDDYFANDQKLTINVNSYQTLWLKNMG